MSASSENAMTSPRHHLSTPRAPLLDIMLAVLGRERAAARQLGDDAAFLHRIDAARDRAYERQVLLDERKRGSAREIAEYVLQVRHDAGREALGGFIEKQHLGLAEDRPSYHQ